MGLVAAGCAFYGAFALFPAISLLISLFGLVFDPATVEPQLAAFRGLVPEGTYELIERRVHEVIASPRPRLELGALVSLGILLWSASAGTRALMSGLTFAQGAEERRGFLRFHMTALLLTLGIILAVAVSMALLLVLPLALDFVLASARSATLIHLGALLLFLLLVQTGIAVLYHVGPPERRGRIRFATWGSVLATLLWVAASIGFTWYVGRFASYDRMYGPLGVSVVLLLWFYIAAFAVLFGAELDAVLARRVAPTNDARDRNPGG